MRLPIVALLALWSVLQVINAQPGTQLRLPNAARFPASVVNRSQLGSAFFRGTRPGRPTGPAPGDPRPPVGTRVLPNPIRVVKAGQILTRDRIRVRPAIAQNPGRVIPEVIAEAVQRVRSEDDVMRRRFNRGIDMHTSSFQTIDPLLFSESPLDASEISRQSRLINWIARLLRFQGSSISLSSALVHSDAARNGIRCPYRVPACSPTARYRTVDGTCNNLRNPLWGSAFTPFVREVRAEYKADVVSKRDDLPRTTNNQNIPLGAPRDISLAVHQAPHTTEDDSIWTMEFSLWGQFMTHDIVDKAPIKGFNGSMLNCCDQSIPTPGTTCVNMRTRSGDIFRGFQRPCLGLSRSLEVTSLDCSKGIREQLNQASSFIDGGPIYGVTNERTRQLRAFRGGLLKLSEPDELPIIPHDNVQASLHGFSYFASGDDRVNVYAGLIAIETVWMREHNRVAKRLAGLNPHWDDETLFQETRRIIVAMVQHITYTDYLEGTVGSANMRDFGLKPEQNNYFTGYNVSRDPALSNAFAASAMRFGHSMIRDSFTKRDRSYNIESSPALNLKDIFFRSSVFLKDEDPLMRGFVADPSPKCDRVMADGLVNHLHQTAEGNGGDLAAINIQRNREHGIPSYNTYRRLYGLSAAQQFDTSPLGFPDQTQETVNLFRQMYRHPEDVELWSAGLSEIPVDSSTAVGPLFAKMMARQFRDLKQGDRFYYETNDPIIRFTPAQLDEIRKIRFSKVLCNTMKFDTIQPNPFLVETTLNNARRPCADLEDINFSHWREF